MEAGKTVTHVVPVWLADVVAVHRERLQRIEALYSQLANTYLLDGSMDLILSDWLAAELSEADKEAYRIDASFLEREIPF